MASSRWFRMELALLWVVFSFAAGYLLAGHFRPYEPGGPKAIKRASTLDTVTSGGRP